MFSLVDLGLGFLYCGLRFSLSTTCLLVKGGVGFPPVLWLGTGTRFSV